MSVCNDLVSESDFVNVTNKVVFNALRRLFHLFQEAANNSGFVHPEVHKLGFSVPQREPSPTLSPLPW